MSRSRIIVRGLDVTKPPLLDTDEACIVEVRDGFDEMIALMTRIFSDEMWGVVTKDDPDWQEALVRYGYVDPRRPVKDIIQSGL